MTEGLMEGLSVSLWLMVLCILALSAALLFVVVSWQRDRRAAEAAYRALKRETEGLSASISAAPVASLELRVGDAGAPVLKPSSGLVEALDLARSDAISLDDLTARLSSQSARALAEGVSHLVSQGASLDLLVQLAGSERSFAVTSTNGGDRFRLWFQDITAIEERLRTARRESEDLKTLIDNLPFPVWRRDQDLRIIDCNATYAQALEATREAVLAEGLELLGRSQRTQALALAREALEGDGPAARESHVILAGQRRLMELREQRLPEGSLLGSAFDKTGEEELRAELKRHLDAQAVVLENLGTAIAIYGADMHLTFYNSAYARIWQVDEDFFQGSPHLGSVLEALRERRCLPEHPNFPAYKQDLIKSYSTLIDSREELVHLPDGRTLRMLVVPYPLGGVLLSYEDVTDLLAIERNYNTLIEVQRETLDKLYEGVAVYGADGLLRLSNPAFAEIWQIPGEALQGQPHVRDIVQYAKRFSKLDDAAWKSYSERVVAETTDPSEASGRRERADGTVIDWARVLLPDGAVLYTFVDVTDSLQVERVLRERNEALETADRLKSEFIANVSYELRTPLNAIVGFAEILTKQFYGSLNERQLEYAEAIVESSHRLIALINDILDLASIEAGYLHIDREEVDVAGLMDSLMRLGRERAHNQEVALELDCPENIGSISADSRRLKQALFNVLSNALKFTPQGGRVTMKAVRRDDAVDFIVADTGIGIPKEDRERVFGRFERSSHQGRQSGAGLGLALVRSLIKLHGGEVTLTSGQEGGTVVTCHLPQLSLLDGEDRKGVA